MTYITNPEFNKSTAKTFKVRLTEVNLVSKDIDNFVKKTDFNNYLKKYEKEIKLKNKRKHEQILICFLMEDMMQLNLLKAIVQ